MNINVPKSSLPDCAVGEKVEMEIVGEDGDSFILSPYEEADEPATPAPKKAAAKPKAAKGKGKRPKAVAKALAYGEE